MSMLVVGSIALDSIKTPYAVRERVLGGSASYASVAASFFGPVNLVGIVGDDFPENYIELFERRGINLAGLQRVPGRTFFWSGEYEKDWNTRQTLEVQLNVFESFQPRLPEAYKASPYVLLGNIAPGLQIHVLDQLNKPQFVAADTMDLWITNAQDDLKALLKRVDMIILNDGEARQLTGEDNLVRAAEALREMGPPWVAIKKGVHGCLLFGPNEDALFAAPAYPLREIADPTGAGDCFAGALVGHLAAQSKHDFEELRRAVIHGTTLASFNVEAFSLDRLEALQETDRTHRFNRLREMTRF